MEDFCTIVSIMPLAIHEEKPSVQPGVFDIPAADENDFSILHVGPGVAYIYIDMHRGQMPKNYSSKTMAESVINDMLNGGLMISPDARPGVFYVEGKLSHEECLKNEEFKTKMIAAKAQQLKWFQKLVARADDSWKKNGQHKLITDMERAAARRLKIRREWIETFSPADLINCPGCGEFVSNKFAFCKHCKTVINLEAAKSLINMDNLASLGLSKAKV